MTDRLIAIFLIMGLTGAPHSLVAQVPVAELNRILDEAPFDRHLWGIVVTDTNGRILYGRNHDRLFIPASNTKLLVTAAAAVLLAGDGMVRTSVYASGPLVRGVLEGDLVLYGRGDPTMSRRCFSADTAGTCERDPLAQLRDLARQLKARGMRTVAGDLVGDGSWFEPSLIHPTWETGDVAWWYAAPVSGLAVNDNSVDLRIRPGLAVGAPAQLTPYPIIAELALENRTRTAPAGSPSTFDLVRVPGTWKVLAVGDVPIDAAPRTQYYAVPEPNRYAALILRDVLAAEGIAVQGEVRSTTDSVETRIARSTPPLAEVSSRPFHEWYFPILNSSQNLFAEMLLKQLGKQITGTGSWETGVVAERRFLIDSIGVDSTQFTPRDGSGLSANNLVTPLAFAQILVWMRQHRSWPQFSAALPRSGATGSLRIRLNGDEFRGRIMAKTGTISSVNALSGYVENAAGQTLIFSILANHHTLGSTRMVARIDSVVAALARGR